MRAYITVNTVSEFFCLVISMLCLYREKDRVWKNFILFLLLTCMVEVSGIYIRRIPQSNFMLYNIFLVVECAVLNYFFYHLFKVYHNLKVLLAGWFVVFVIFYFIELYVKHFNAYVSNSSTIMSVELILAGVYYYYRLLKEEKYRQLSKDAPFWWVNGTICFYFAGIAGNLFFKYLLQEKGIHITHTARYIVFSILNVILYSCWSYSFICRYFQRTSSS